MKKKQKQPSIIRNIIYIACVLLGIYILSLIFLDITTRHNKELIVPDFRGLSIEQANEQADILELKLDITDSVYIKSMKRGAISKQNPMAGSKVKKNRRILLTINSNQAKLIEVPDLKGLSLRQAKTVASSKGLNIGRLIYVEDIATNNVLSQEIKGRKVKPKSLVEAESTIDLVLGVNPDEATTLIPNVLGYKYLTARDILLNNSLNIAKVNFDSTISTYADSLSAVVYSQSPKADNSTPYRKGRAVSIFLTLDQEKIDGILKEQQAQEEQIKQI